MSPLTSKEWSFTCAKCHYVPDEDWGDDFIRVVRTDPNHKLYGYEKTINLRWPQRCNKCEADKKRSQRLRKAISRVFGMSTGIGSFYTTYNFPKLITFALPSTRTMEYNDRWKDIEILNSKMPKAIKLLMKSGTLGGTFVIECTSRLVPFNDGGVLMEWKHHAHVHMVAVSRFVHWKKLPSYCEMLMPIGLGRINLEAAKNSYRVANYIGKYLAKENQRSRTFGIMRKVPKWEKQCNCKHEDMEINATFCGCYIER